MTGVNPLVIQVISVLGVIATAIATAASGGNLSWQEGLMVALAAVGGWMQKRPNDVPLKVHAAKVEEAYVRGARESARPTAMPAESADGQE